jgi:hypothetical protein
MTRVGFTAAVMALVAMAASGGEPMLAQSRDDQQDALRRQVERRFEVLHLQDGLALRPRNDISGVKLIQLTDDNIVIDGAPVTGGELRAKLGAEAADLVIRLSYLQPQARRQLFENAAPAAPVLPEITIEPPVPPVPPAPPNPPRSRRSRRGDGGDRVRFGGSVTVEEGETVMGDAVAIGGSVRIDGKVLGDAVAIGGSLTLGPHADVSGDAVVIGGTMKRDPDAQVGGKVVDVGGGNFDFSRLGGRFPFGLARAGAPFFGAATRVFALMSTLARVAVLCVLACLVILVGRDYVERVGARAVAEPVKSGAIGLLAQVFFVPVLVITCVTLVVTIIGIPFLVLIPFAILALVAIGLVGFTAVAYNLGRFVHQRLHWSDDNPYLATISGIVLVISPVLVARLLGLADWLLFPVTGALIFLGFLLEYLTWTVGFGAVALLRFAQPRAVPTSAPPATA